MQSNFAFYAEIAQLVEHNLAKVRVAGSSPVFRSKQDSKSFPVFFMDSMTESVFLHHQCPDGGIGRHEGLKIPWPRGCAGSSPAPGTKTVWSLEDECGGEL